MLFTPSISRWHQGSTGENTGVRFLTPPILNHVVAFLKAGIRHEIGLASLLAGMTTMLSERSCGDPRLPMEKPSLPIRVVSKGGCVGRF